MTTTILDIIHCPVFYTEKKKVGGGGGVVKDATVLEGGVETEFGSLEGSQAVPASPSGKGEACIGDLSNPVFYLKLNSIGVSVLQRKHITSPLRAQQVNAMYRIVTMSRFDLKPETESGLRNAVVLMCWTQLNRFHLKTVPETSTWIVVF
jgi:hypothetical protein